MAAQQLEFLRELTASIEKPAELAYLSAVVAKQKNLPAEAILKYLNEALEAHFARMRGLAFNMAYLKLINPDLVLKIVREYLLFAPQEVQLYSKLKIYRIAFAGAIKTFY